MTTVTKSNSPFNISSGVTSTGEVVVSGGSMFVLSGGDGRYDDGQFGGLPDRRQRRKGERYDPRRGNDQRKNSY
jgi:hypothetical protein